jgi:hypothetical protein
MYVTIDNSSITCYNADTGYVRGTHAFALPNDGPIKYLGRDNELLYLDIEKVVITFNLETKAVTPVVVADNISIEAIASLPGVLIAACTREPRKVVNLLTGEPVRNVSFYPSTTRQDRCPDLN